MTLLCGWTCVRRPLLTPVGFFNLHQRGKFELAFETSGLFSRTAHTHTHTYRCANGGKNGGGWTVTTIGRVHARQPVELLQWCAQQLRRVCRWWTRLWIIEGDERAEDMLVDRATGCDDLLVPCAQWEAEVRGLQVHWWTVRKRLKIRRADVSTVLHDNYEG